MKIEIDNELKKRWENICLGILIYSAKVEESSSELLELFQKSIEELSNEYSISDIVNIPHIQSTRNAYKVFGKSPSQYRNAAESMIRRIVKGNGLYYINNIIEINNFMSITTGYSVGSYDMDSISEPIELKISPNGEKYQGIGKDDVNIEHLPTLYDKYGAFGNPTSDNRRSMVEVGNHNIMSVIYSFDGESDLQKVMDRYCELLRKYCLVDNINVMFIC